MILKRSDLAEGATEHDFLKMKKLGIKCLRCKIKFALVVVDGKRRKRTILEMETVDNLFVYLKNQES